MQPTDDKYCIKCEFGNSKALQCSLATYQWPQIPHMLSPTVFEDANEERVVTLNVPPGGRWVVLWLGQIETKRLCWHPFHDLVHIWRKHAPANDV